MHGKGKAAAPYEFGVKASIVTNNRRAPGGLFVLHARALPDNPYDGHTLRDVIDRTETLTGCAIERAYVDKGYRGHDAQNPRRIFISGQKRGVFGVIKRELRRRAAIGHLKARLEVLSLPRPGGGVHRQGKAAAFRVRCQSLFRHQQPPCSRWLVRIRPSRLRRMRNCR